jgi:hypothetical protein
VARGFNYAPTGTHNALLEGLGALAALLAFGL